MVIVWLMLAVKLLLQVDNSLSTLCPVSYTHLDVYKRQGLEQSSGKIASRTAQKPLLC